MRRSKKTSKLRVSDLCAGNSPVTGDFPAQMARNAERFPFDDVIMSTSFVIKSDSQTVSITQSPIPHRTSAWGNCWFISTNLFIKKRCYRYPTEPPCWDTWWRHQMETLAALLDFCAGIHRSPVNSLHKGQWRGALMFYLIFARINGWLNIRGAGDLRRHRAHYDVDVMILFIDGFWDTIICGYMMRNNFITYVVVFKAMSSRQAIIWSEAMMASLTLSQSTLAGPVYTGMPLEYHWLT